MMSRLSLCFVVMLTGCVGLPATATPSSATDAFPTRVSGTDLPSVRAVSERLVASEPLTADVDLCVTPEGDTSRVLLRRSSGDEMFDGALLRDVNTWRYAPTARDRMKCEQATITYVP
jgi:TonB family protein